MNTHRYPTWTSLARDYLAIMASSVSSKRAFSLAGITISKRCNRLKGDVVEAIECIKCLIHNDLVFRDVPTLEQLTEELEGMEIDGEGESAPVTANSEPFSWDSMLAEDEEVTETDRD